MIKAAPVAVKAESAGGPRADRLFDPRVDDHPEPLRELRRPARLRRAYNRVDAGAAGNKRPPRAF